LATAGAFFRAPKISAPVINTVVLLDLMAPPAAIANAIGEHRFVAGHIGDDDEIIVAKAIPTTEQFAANGLACLPA
jgi:hypothetical protein